MNLEISVQWSHETHIKYIFQSWRCGIQDRPENPATIAAREAIGPRHPCSPELWLQPQSGNFNSQRETSYSWYFFINSLPIQQSFIVLYSVASFLHPSGDRSAWKQDVYRKHRRVASNSWRVGGWGDPAWNIFHVSDFTTQLLGLGSTPQWAGR